MINKTPKDYRKDIDGLRAIAVLSVIIHHLDKNLLSGGFVGVDIFFVISGFLITSHIYHALKTNTFSFGTFYKKRINRITPALLTVITVSICCGLIILSPADLIRLTNSALTSISGLSNIYFWREYGNYFSANTNEAILLHTWSLGVEEQFYLIWPILLVIVTKITPKPSHILFLLLLIFITTLIVSDYATSLFASASYYLLPSRFFELAIGGLLAIYSPTKKYSSLLCLFIKAVGLLLIIYALLTFNGQTSFPGLNALTPCLGAFLIILAGNLGKPAYLLSIKPLQITGLLSYSLYLWHWPMIAFLNYLYLPINLVSSIVIIIMAYLLSFLTWRFIELPCRVKGNKKNFIHIFTTRVGIPFIILLILTVLTHYWQGFPQRFPMQVSTLEQITLIKPNELRKGCHVTNQQYQTAPNDNCILGIANKSIDGLLIGDSYANHFSGMIDEIAKVKQWRITDYTMDACPPILNYANELSTTYGKHCISRNEYIDQLIEKNHYKYIILAASWPQDNNVYPYLKETLVKYLKSGTKVIIILNNPTIDHAATCPIRQLIFNRQISCIVKQPTLADYWSEIKRLYPQITFIDPNRIICKNNECTPIINNIPLYRDNGHLNDVGSRLLGKELLKQNSLFEM